MLGLISPLYKSADADATIRCKNMVFEHVMDELIATFWYGIIEFETTAEIEAAMKTRTFDDTWVKVALEDGRKGKARLTSTHLYERTMRIGVVGINDLR